MSNHRWSPNDDLVALYLSRHGSKLLGVTEEQIAARLGMNVAALSMRQANFKYLDKKPGLSGYFRQSEAVHEAHGHASEPAMRALILDVLG